MTKKEKISMAKSRQEDKKNGRMTVDECNDYSLRVQGRFLRCVVYLLSVL